MHTIVTADDEDIARKSLEFLLMSEIYDIQLVASARNGAELICIVDQYKPDLAIVDIDMPIINGIEAIKFLMERGTTTRFILNTAYDDFNFMQQAIDLKISGYLLKSDKREKSLKTIRNIIEDIDSMNEKQKKIDSLTKMEEKMLPILENEIMYSIFLDNPAEESFNTWCNIKKVKFKGLFVISFISTSNKISLFHELINSKQFSKTTIEESVGKLCHCIPIITKNSGCLLIGMSENLNNINPEEWIIKIMKSFKASCTATLALDLIIGISDICVDFSTIMPAYHNSLKILQNVVSSGVYYNKNKGNLIVDTYQIQLSDELLNILIIGNKDKLESIFLKIDLNEIESFYYLYELMCKTSNHLPSISSSFFCSLLSKKSRLKNHDNFNSFKKCLLELLESNSSLQIVNTNPYVDRATSYIKQNAFKSISLNIVAEEIGISPFYLSRLLKSHLGITFIDMLTNIRMAKALELVSSTRMQVQEIATNIGYPNTTYFCKVFKKYTGKSISEYRLEKLNTK
jgi:two-component system response regulator YesN